MTRRPYAVPLALGLALTLAGCGGGTTTGSTTDDGRLGVSAGFYPLEFAAKQVGGDHVEVTSLTKLGAEPHDLELTPKDVATLTKSAVVLYVRGFQPAVDKAVADSAPAAGFDVAEHVELDVAATDDGHDHSADDGHDDEGEAPDPHFWLDPTKYASAVTAIGEEFAAKDSANAAAYRKNAADLVAELTALDEEFTHALDNCRSTDLVTGHAAFGYLAARYGMTQLSISGVSPDAEPTAAGMKAIADVVTAEGISTIYAETLVSPALAETIGRETGASVAVLDPLEGITDNSAGTDYLEIMRSNLRTLVKGQECR